MSSDVRRLVQASPMLSGGGHVSIGKAAAAIGIERDQIFRAVEDRQVTLYARLVHVRGHVLPWVDLELDNPAMGRAGGVLVPPPSLMPESASETSFTGLAALPDGAEYATEILKSGLESLKLRLFDVGKQPSVVFVAQEEQVVAVDELQVAALEIEELQKRLLKKLTKRQIQQALERPSEPSFEKRIQNGMRPDMLFSEALEAYAKEASGLPKKITSLYEQRQRKNGCALFIDFMGDQRIGDVNDEMLRAFRDGPLTKIPKNANNLPASLRRTRMSETIETLRAANIEYQCLSADGQRERMQWLNKMFEWMVKPKRWIAFNPCEGLSDEQTLTAAELKDIKRSKDDEDEEGRPPFTPAELKLIFSQVHYQTGLGDHVSGNEVWYPFQYWLPLIGLFTGLRIKEASQLHLTDVRQDDVSVWYLDINESTKDKSLKNEASKRRVALHPLLIELGFLTYCERLKEEGFKRVFPELSYSITDARYAKEPKRKMSAMLAKLEMPRDSSKVFHCLRHNFNDALQRVSSLALPDAEDTFRTFLRYRLLGHSVGKDANKKHYTSVTNTEARTLISAVSYDIPHIVPLDIDFSIKQVKSGLNKKKGDRHGSEDMGPLNL